MSEPIDPTKLKPGDTVGHADCDYLLFEVESVRVEEGDEDIPSSVREVKVRSLRTGTRWAFEDGDMESNLGKLAPPSAIPAPATRRALEKKQIRDHEELAATSFAGFELEGGHSCVYPGLRKWRFRGPRGSWHWFELVVWENNLLVTGDMAPCWWKIGGNSLQWAANHIDHVDCLRKSVVKEIATVEPCDEQAKAWVWGEFAEKAEEHLLGGGLRRMTGYGKYEGETIEHLTEVRDELLNWAEETDGPGFIHRLYHDTEWIDGCDCPELNRNTYTFLWGWSALKVALRLLGYTKKEAG